MTEPVKIPDHHDMDWGQFKQHWIKRHAEFSPHWNNVVEKYYDDDSPIWWAIRNIHERNHEGRGRRDHEEPDGPCPTDHIHLPRIDPELVRILEELL